jgi:hypothetical protein
MKNLKQAKKNKKMMILMNKKRKILLKKKAIKIKFQLLKHLKKKLNKKKNL